MLLDAISGFQRLFIAISVPDEVQKEIARAQSRLKREAPPGTIRWTRPEQFHITLKFLGDVPTGQMEILKDSISSACSNSSALQISAHGTGFFPSPRNPRVIWVGAHNINGDLAELHRRLIETLHWINPNERPVEFAGHVTLGRFKPGHHAAIPRIIELANTFREREFGHWQTTEIKLVRSELGSTGAEHIVIGAYPLKMS